MKWQCLDETKPAINWPWGHRRLRSLLPVSNYDIACSSALYLKRRSASQQHRLLLVRNFNKHLACKRTGTVVWLRKAVSQKGRRESIRGLFEADMCVAWWTWKHGGDDRRRCVNQPGRRKGEYRALLKLTRNFRSSVDVGWAMLIWAGLMVVCTSIWPDVFDFTSTPSVH
jgi:hypothetical protein